MLKTDDPRDVAARFQKVWVVKQAANFTIRDEIRAATMAGKQKPIQADLLLPIAARQAKCRRGSRCVVVGPNPRFLGTTTSAFRLLPVTLVKWMPRQPQGQHQDEKGKETSQPGGAHNLAARPSDQAHAPLAAATPFRISGHNPNFRRSRPGSASRRLRTSTVARALRMLDQVYQDAYNKPLLIIGDVDPISSDQICKETIPSQANHCVATDW